MPYLPPGLINQSEFPASWGKDLLMAVRMIEEEYKRFGTLINYHPILKATTPATDINSPVGTPPATRFDPLYGEAVDASMTTVVQPHLSGTYQAANPILYGTPSPVRAKIFRSELDIKLKRYGFDKTRELVVTFPTSILDRNGITLVEGDYLEWDGHNYEVKEVGRDEYWHNSNVQLYITCACNAWRMGS